MHKSSTGSSLIDISSFIQADNAKRKIVEKSHLDLFSCVTEALFGESDQSSQRSTALRHAVQTQLMDVRGDVMDVLIMLLEPFETPPKDDEDKMRRLEEARTQLSNQVLEPSTDIQHLSIYLYCVATFLGIDVYTASPESDNFRWRCFKCLKLSRLKKRFHQNDTVFDFTVNKGKFPCLMLFIEDDETNIIVHHIEPCDPGAPVPPCPGLLEDLMTYLKEIPLEEIEIPDELITKVRANWRKLDKAVVSLTALAKEYCEELFVRDPVYRHKISDVRCNRRLYLPRITEMLAGSDPEPRKVFCQILLKQLDIQTLKLVSDNLDLKKIEHFRKYSALARLERAVQQFCEVASQTEKHDSLSDEFRQTRRCVNNTVIATSATALVGGVFAVAGILVTPVAAGLSLGLTISGGVIGCVSAATQSGFRIHEAVKENRVVAGIEKELMASERAVEKSMAEVCELFSDFHDISLKGKPASTERSFARGAFSVGSIFRSMHSFVGVAVSAASVGAGAAVATASVFGPIGLLLDVGLMAEAIRNKLRGNRTNAGKALECLGAFQTVFGALLRGNVDTSVNIVESPSFAAVDRRLSRKYSTM